MSLVRHYWKELMNVCDKDECGLWPLTTGPNDPFIASCKWHDEMYRKQEGGQLAGMMWTKDKVDNRFFRAMIQVCEAEENEKKRGELYERMAYYVLACRWLGGLAW